eukprot:3513403-Pleurochrysis_carterae.AAC.1
MASALLAAKHAREYEVVFAAPPCSSFSVAHRLQVRNRRRSGLRTFSSTMPWRSSRQIWCRRQEAAGIPWELENPADCGDPHGLALRPRLVRHAPL